MATNTLKEIRDIIRLDGNLSKKDFPNARLNFYINEAQRDLQLKLIGAIDLLDTISPTLTTGTFGKLSYKAIKREDITGLIEVPDSISYIDVSDGTNKGIAYMMDKFDFEERGSNPYGNVDLSTPAFTESAGEVWLIPDSITTATVYYKKIAPDLVDDNATPIVPQEYVGQLIQIVLRKVRRASPPPEQSITEAVVKSSQDTAEPITQE